MIDIRKPLEDNQEVYPYLHLDIVMAIRENPQNMVIYDDYLTYLPMYQMAMINDAKNKTLAWISELAEKKKDTQKKQLKADKGKVESHDPGLADAFQGDSIRAYLSQCGKDLESRLHEIGRALVATKSGGTKPDYVKYGQQMVAFFKADPKAFEMCLTIHIPKTMRKLGKIRSWHLNPRQRLTELANSELEEKDILVALQTGRDLPPETSDPMEVDSPMSGQQTSQMPELTPTVASIAPAPVVEAQGELNPDNDVLMGEAPTEEDVDDATKLLDFDVTYGAGKVANFNANQLLTQPIAETPNKLTQEEKKEEQSNDGNEGEIMQQSGLPNEITTPRRTESSETPTRGNNSSTKKQPASKGDEEAGVPQPPQLGRTQSGISTLSAGSQQNSAGSVKSQGSARSRSSKRSNGSRASRRSNDSSRSGSSRSRRVSEAEAGKGTRNSRQQDSAKKKEKKERERREEIDRIEKEKQRKAEKRKAAASKGAAANKKPPPKRKPSADNKSDEDSKNGPRRKNPPRNIKPPKKKTRKDVLQSPENDQLYGGSSSE